MTIQFSFQIKKETARKIQTFEEIQKFCSFGRFRFFRSSIRISIFFRIFEISLDYAFLDWKGHKIVSSLQKTSEKLDQRFWRYRTSKKKYYWNFAACGFGTLIFGPWGHKLSPIFVFMCYFCFVIRNKEFDNHKGYLPCFSGKSNFFTPFRTIASFYKISHRAKTSGRRKKRMWFWGW